MGIYHLNGGSPLEAWNALIEDVNDLVDECPNVEELELKEAPHLWAKEDIEEVQDKLIELCPDNEFEEIPDLWRKDKIDELIEAIENGTCCCEGEVITFDLSPTNFFCPNRFFGGRTTGAFCIGAEAEKYMPFEEKYWGGSIAIIMRHDGAHGQPIVNAFVEWSDARIGCDGNIEWYADGVFVPFFTQVVIASNPDAQNPISCALFVLCPGASLGEALGTGGIANWGGEIFINFGDEADQCCAAVFGACNLTCPYPCSRNSCETLAVIEGGIQDYDDTRNLEYDCT